MRGEHGCLEGVEADELLDESGLLRRAGGVDRAKRQPDGPVGVAGSLAGAEGQVGADADGHAPEEDVVD